MNLCIVLDEKNNSVSRQIDSSLYPEMMSIAGKEILQYWLEWANYKGYTAVTIYSTRPSIENLNMIHSVYGVKVNYHTLEDLSHIQAEDDVYYGVGLFNDEGVYQVLQDLDEILALERALLVNPLVYCTQVGYDARNQIQIGKNVYMHHSVELMGNVVIGNDCIVEQGVSIKDSVINQGCLIKTNSVIYDCHISKNIHMTQENLYLENKALFSSDIYDISRKKSMCHAGLFVTKHLDIE